nr:MAG TPA: hypothetical protein [Crassvirales sp.]
MMGKMNNVIRIPTSISTSFFRFWFEFLRPFHNLTDREMQVASSLLKRRYELSKVIQDEVILDKVVMSEDTKKVVREECNISLPHFQVIMGKLRKNKIILDGRINPRFIPNLTEEQGSFRLLLNFELN